jgi:hypothetical protein
MTYKTGSIGDFMRWTKQVVTDPVAAKDTPKRWFDSDETAAKSLGTSASPEAMVKLLSAENLVLLQIIGTERLASLRALAALVHRKESNLSRTLKKCTKRALWISRWGQGACARHGLLSERGMFDPIETWEEFLAELQAMPDFVWKEGASA